MDDVAAKDPIQKKIAGLAVPGIQVNIFSVDKFLNILTKTTIKKRTMLLFGNPINVLKVKKSGLIEMDYVNISGMRFNNDRTRLHKNVSVTEEERKALEELIYKENVEVYAQTTTNDDKMNVKNLLENK